MGRQAVNSVYGSSRDLVEMSNRPRSFCLTDLLSSFLFQSLPTSEFLLQPKNFLEKKEARLRLDFFLKVPRSGVNLGFFSFRLFSLTSSALDHSATAPPLG